MVLILDKLDRLKMTGYFVTATRPTSRYPALDSVTCPTMPESLIAAQNGVWGQPQLAAIGLLSVKLPGSPDQAIRDGLSEFELVDDVNNSMSLVISQPLALARS